MSHNSPVSNRRILPRRPFAFGKEMIREYLSALDSPIALKVWLLYVSGDYLQLVQLSIDPLDYNDADKFRRDYAAVKLFSRNKTFDTGIDKVAVAIEKSVAAEEHCRLTNVRIKELRSGTRVPGPESAIWFRAKGIIAKILGSVPTSFPDVGWSKGRTSSCGGVTFSAVTKYSSRLDVTRRALPRALRMLRSSFLWGQAALNADGPCSVLPRALSVVESNTMITVPKNAKTDRVICYEPHLNIRLQLQVGSYVRARLRRFGVNLDDQTVNQRRARFGSKYGSLSTIDLSSASDTLALEVVYELLPVDWALLLDDLRSSKTAWPDGVTRTNEKFSSMGNGYTFELESLIFYAICCSVTDNVTVYGDDLVIPTDSYEQVVQALSLTGFLVNESKSFCTSYFRESCGGDYFAGVDVTPPKLVSDLQKVSDVAHFWNRIFESNYPFGDRAFLNVFTIARRTGLPLGPMGFGDGHLNANFDVALPTRVSGQWDAWWYSTYALIVQKSQPFNVRDFAAALCAATDPKRNRVGELGRSSTKRLRLTACAWPSVIWI